MKKLSAFILALAMLCCAAGCGKTEKEPDETVAIWSEDTEVTVSMYAYFFNAYYKSFANTYRHSLEDMGLDTSQRLKSQFLKNDESSTWFEYMMVNCYDRVKQTMYMADAAKNAGMEITAEDRKYIDQTLEEYDSAAKADGVTTDEYLAELFTDKVVRATVEKCLELETLAVMYYDGILIETPTDEECQKSFEENSRPYLYYDCYRITVPESDGDALAACGSEQEFKDCAKQIIAKNNFESNYEKYADTIDSLVENKIVRRCRYTEDSKTSEWAFEEARKPYDVYTAPSERDGQVTVYMILPSPETGRYSQVLYRDEERVRSLDWLHFDRDIDAKRVYSEWADGEKTEESFAKLFGQYEGGYSEAVDRGDFEAAVSSEIFDKDMAISESALIEDSEGGAYIIYMIGRGEPSWLVDVKNDITNNLMNETLKSLEEKYPCEYSDAIYTVEDVAIFSGTQS